MTSTEMLIQPTAGRLGKGINGARWTTLLFRGLVPLIVLVSQRLTRSGSAAFVAALSFGALALSSPAAQARDWYILNFKTGTCVAAETVVPQSPTPQQFHTALRNDGIVDEVAVTKADDGEVAMVSMTYSFGGNGPATMMWFPVSAICERVRQVEVANGSLPDMDDLK